VPTLLFCFGDVIGDVGGVDNVDVFGVPHLATYIFFPSLRK
jgi:hypothetical protein